MLPLKLVLNKVWCLHMVHLDTFLFLLITSFKMVVFWIKIKIFRIFTLFGRKLLFWPNFRDPHSNQKQNFLKSYKTSVAHSETRKTRLIWEEFPEYLHTPVNYLTVREFSDQLHCLTAPWLLSLFWSRSCKRRLINGNYSCVSWSKSQRITV